MKEFIRSNGKVAGLFAAAALVLSFLTGILRGNPIGTVVLRAVLLAVVFGGLGIGLQLVVRRFLPELAGGASARPADAPPDGEDSGTADGPRVVDIVLPEENPILAGNRGVAAEPSGSSEVEELELQEDLGEASGLDPVGEALPTDAVGPGAGPAAAEPESVTATSGPAGMSGLDALPDIGSLEPSGPRQGRSRLARTSLSGAAADEARRSMAEDEDPSTLARAVRTVLKRDEKG
jgi:hypothetical protein